MKFKKTKLTALALSVLMAASTITSVTWAADLFTDGAAEVVVETVTNVEAEEVASESILLGDNTTNTEVGYPVNVAFYYNSVGEVVAKYQVQNVNSQTHAPQGAPGNLVSNVATRQQKGSLKARDCENPERAIYEFMFESTGKYYSSVNADVSEISGADSATGYIPTYKSTAAGHSDPTEIEVVGTESTCIEKGENWVYTGCTKCNSYYDPNKKKFSKVTAENVKADKQKIDQAATSGLGVTGLNYPLLKRVPAELKSHTYTNAKIFKISDSYAEAHQNTDFGGENYKPVNCIVYPETDSFKVIDETKDAWYYTAQECTVCHKPKMVKQEWAKLVNDIDAGIYCEKGRNIKGFVVLQNGSLTVDSTSPRVLRDKVEAAVLTDCTKEGVYYVRQYQAGQRVPVSEETVTVKAGTHAWGNIEIETAEINPKTKTEYNNLLMDPTTGKPAVLKNARGDVTEAYSKNCVTKAKYELCRVCLSGCGTWQDCGDVIEAPVNPDSHSFGEWSREYDPEMTTYTDRKDGTSHIKHLNYSRECIYCGVKDTKPYANIKELHELYDKKIEGSDVAPTCGEAGSYQTALTCVCEYVKEGTETTTVVPATDKHDFGTNEAFIEWKGEVQVGDGKGDFDPKHEVYAYIVRKCNVCGKTDSNGINGVTPADGDVGGSTDRTLVNKPGIAVTGKGSGRTVSAIVPAKKDPSTGVTYPCSTAHCTVTIDWVGSVDGKTVKLNEKKENVPYYDSLYDYVGRTAHQAGPAVKENNVAPTDTTEGSYDEVIYCKVCGDEMSRKTITIPMDVQVSVPTVTAVAANYNTVNVSWTPVEGATSYRLYYRSTDLGITTWHRVRTLKGTSFTHSGLTTGARYRYTVRAEVNGKLGDYSRTGSVARPLPAAPEMKSVTAVSNGTRVTWSKVDGADGYIIFRKTPTGTFTRVGSVSKGTKVTWTDKKAVSGSTYKVRAYRTVDNVNYKGAFSAVM